MVEEKTIHDVEVPSGISARQVTLAKAYVSERLQEGFTMNGFFKKYSISSKTFYDWTKIPEYEKYINELSHVLIDENELEAVRKMKKKIMGYADKATVSTQEMKIFTETFSYIFEAEAKLQAEKLGLNKDIKAKGESDDWNSKTLEEKKAYLFKELTQ